jgi:TolB protein
MRAGGLLVGAIAGACLVAGCGSGSPSRTASSTSTPATSPQATTTTTTAPLGRGAEAQRGDIPWSQVGPGWTLAEWSSVVPTGIEPPPSTVPGQTTSLYLVNPSGGRYLVTTLPYATTQSLTAWSGDGRRALLAAPAGNGTTVTEMDLASGSQHSFTVPESVALSYSNPQGLAILATTQIGSTLERLSTTGTLQLTYPKTFSGLGSFNGASASSPDGTQIAMGTLGGGVALVANDGSVVATLPVPGTSYCSPVRWWTTSEILASCTTSSSDGAPLLWLVPISGSPTALTVPPPAGSSDAGDEVAWQVGSSTFLQDAGGCGYQYLAELGPNHTTTPVTVPGVVNGDSQFVLGTVGEQIGLQTSISCGPGLSLLWFNPQTAQVNVVLGPGMNGGSVSAAILFGDNNGELR